MDRKKLAGALLAGVLVLQSLASLLWLADPTTKGVALALNAAAAVSTALFLRRDGHSPWVVVAWCAGFLGWHALGLGALAGWWTPDLAGLFAVAAHLQASIAYQAVLTTAAGFALHILLPRTTNP